MKSVKFILAAAALFVGVSAMAQDFSDDAKYGKWGATAEERASNIGASNYLKEALDAKDFAAATEHFQQLLNNCPKASQNTFARGVTLYKNKAQRARSVEQKRMFVDSILFIYDQRVIHFGDHPKNGKDYILDMKARDMLRYCTTDRPLLRAGLKEAVDAAIESGRINLDIVSSYYKNLCEDFEYDDEVTSDMVLAEYERLSPLFADIAAEDEQYRDIFETSFGTSGAASCENLEALFSEKLAADPDNEAILAQAVALMSRAQCTSDFFFATTEKYYTVKPSSETALFLAQGFQGRGENSKALKYLREALAVETDPTAKMPLYTQIGLIEISERNYGAAVEAARELRSINPDSGYAYFILGQCYAASSCPDDKIGGASVYWAAYDAMAQAVNLLQNEPEVQKAAQQLMNAYRGAFPQQETCFFAELSAGDRYTIKCGYAAGQSTTVRYR
ncbi:MAG: enzyme of heme biosynthesis [Alistipes sp.]|nr:enzyme of heme biosynthesis [Alistipes sp.]MBQ8774471.1 enzyme of heme biosynthesis [Alistipes sp.]